MTLMSGGCLCGAVRYEITAKPNASITCHCRDCQYVAGGGPAHVMLFKRDAVRLTKGDTRTVWVTAQSGQRVWRRFCETCETHLFAGSAGRDDLQAVKVGSLDDPSTFRAQAEIWTSSAPPWAHRDTRVPQFRENPTLGGEAVVAFAKSVGVRVAGAVLRRREIG